MTTISNHKKHMLQSGQVLNDRWEILEHIATGGKGEVYRARQPKLKREVAVKVVSQELIDTYEGDQEEIAAEMERFRREVLAMAATRHPNVLQVYDYEQAPIECDGREQIIDYIVMEYIPGDTLSATIPAQGLAGDEDQLRVWISKYFLPVLDGVEHMHGQGIVHRDLKPSNVLLDGEVPKLSDFGLVGGGQWKQVTRSHHVIGTLAYMAPEQYMDLAEAGFRADIYSLGKMLYKAAVGTFDKDTMKPLQAAALPRAYTTFLKALDRVIRKATAQESEERYASVGDLRLALNSLPGMAPIPGPWRRRLALSLSLAAVLAAVLVWGVWYHFEGMQPETAPPASPAAQTAQAPLTGPPAEQIKGHDEASLRLIPTGQAQDGAKVPAFYLGVTQVTNHQFVEFLNAANGSPKVAQGVVKRGDKPWLYLGEVRKGLEPIVYDQGRFRIKDPALAAHPVVKVTAFGAAAYAAHYGRRLPTPAELSLAAAGSAGGAPDHGSSVPVTGDAQMESMHAGMQGEPQANAPSVQGSKEPAYYPVTHYPPNKLGIRGLDSPMGSWAREADGRIVVVEKGDKVQAREAWQGLDWVGFRTALSLKN